MVLLLQSMVIEDQDKLPNTPLHMKHDNNRTEVSLSLNITHKL